MHPLYQGNGLGQQLMAYVLEALQEMGTERVSLFADPGVVTFYQRQGWSWNLRTTAVPSGIPAEAVHRSAVVTLHQLLHGLAPGPGST